MAQNKLDAIKEITPHHTNQIFIIGHSDPDLDSLYYDTFQYRNPKW